MRWRGRRQSRNIEDSGGDGVGPGRGGFPFPFPRRGGMGTGAKRGGIGGIGLIVVIVLMLFFGVDPSSIFQGMPGGSPVPQTQSPRAPAPPTRTRKGQPAQLDSDIKKFVAVVLADTEDMWNGLFAKSNRKYQEPTLRFFSGFVRSACGMAQSASGPFYCPGDRKIYIDTSFYRELKTRFGAPGDFAQAYVVAHEVGHHVQTLLGISDKVVNYRRSNSREAGNAMQVRMELQADCFAGVWANYLNKKRDKQNRRIIESGDIDEALNAASAIGDDRIQRRTQGYVVPDAFTHGSSTQRVRWFKRGFEAGQTSVCNTFNGQQL